MPAPIQTNKRNRPTGAMVTVTNAVDASKIRTETDDNGDEIIILPSYTLPDNVVMNGGLYPADEIEKSYQTLAGTPAPLGHPTNANGEFVSASSEIGVHNFQCGVFNGNVKRENGRVYVEKRINKRVANQSERGKRVLERVEAFMNGEGEPVHTSTGIYLDIETLDKPVTNAAGDSYTWIARNLYHDHDAILLDEQGAATPEKGVGMMVNSALHTNLENSANDKRGMLHDAVREEFTGTGEDEYAWLVDYNDEKVIVEKKRDYFEIGYTIQDDKVSFVGEAKPVVRKTVWKAIANWFGSICGKAGNGLQSNQCDHGGRIISSINEGNDMSFRQKLIDQLKVNSVELDYENVTDDELLSAVNQTATTPATTEQPDLGAAIANALKPVTEKLEALETKLKAKEESELSALREQVIESTELTKEDVQGMSVNAMKKMLANSAPAYHMGGQNFAPNSDNTADLYGKMPSVEV